MATRNQQYCPVSNVELADGMPLSSRIGRDFVRTINNAKSYVTAPMLILNNAFPGGGTLTDNFGDTDEHFWLRWCPVPFPAKFNQIRVVLNGKQRQPGDEVKIRVYADKRLYMADDPVDAAGGGFSADHEVGECTIDSVGYETQEFLISNINFHLQAPGTTAFERNVFLTLTAEPMSGTSARAYITNIAAWARFTS